MRQKSLKLLHRLGTTGPPAPPLRSFRASAQCGATPAVRPLPCRAAPAAVFARGLTPACLPGRHLSALPQQAEREPAKPFKGISRRLNYAGLTLKGLFIHQSWTHRSLKSLNRS